MAPSGVERFRQATTGWELDIREMSSSTHTAKEAAEAVGEEWDDIALMEAKLAEALGVDVDELEPGPRDANAGVLGAGGGPITAAGREIFCQRGIGSGIGWPSG